MVDTRRKKVILVSSHGGHLTELLELSEAFADCDTVHFTYEAETTRPLPRAVLVPNRPYSPWQFLRNITRAASLIRRERPDACVSTGAEIAVAPFLAARAAGIPAIFIECGCQVTAPSFTGRVMRWLATDIFVQWPELTRFYGGRARYAGSLIDDTPP